MGASCTKSDYYDYIDCTRRSKSISPPPLPVLYPPGRPGFVSVPLHSPPIPPVGVKRLFHYPLAIPDIEMETTEAEEEKVPPVFKPHCSLSSGPARHFLLFFFSFPHRLFFRYQLTRLFIPWNEYSFFL